MKLAKILNSGFLKPQILNSAEILTSGFWKAKILKSVKILNSGFWKAKILNAAKILNSRFGKPEILKSAKILNSGFWKAWILKSAKILNSGLWKTTTLKGLKALWRKWHYPLISILLKSKDWARFFRKKWLKECPNCQVMAIFAWSRKTRIFWKSLKGGPREIFSKNRPESSPRLNGLRALWRKWHYPPIYMHLECKDWRSFWRKHRLETVPEWPSHWDCRNVTQNPHFLKKCKGGTRENFSKIA